MIRFLTPLILCAALPAALTGCTGGPASNAKAKPAAAQTESVEALRTRAQAGADLLKNTMIAFYAKAGRMPTEQEGLKIYLTFKPPLVKPEDLTDPWGHPYAYRDVEGEYEIRCAGPDGKLDTPDDLVAH